MYEKRSDPSKSADYDRDFFIPVVMDFETGSVIHSFAWRTTSDEALRVAEWMLDEKNPNRIKSNRVLFGSCVKAEPGTAGKTTNIIWPEKKRV